MITELTINGFKRFASCTLELAPCTVLTGLNGAGKTTVIQSFLLACQAGNRAASSVLLNGPFGLELGSAQDVLNLGAASEGTNIEIILRSAEGEPACLRLDASDETRLNLPITSRPVDMPFDSSYRAFAYLCAERLGPRDVLGASAQPSDDLGVGVQGEFCAQVLELHGLTHRVLDRRLHPEHRAASDTFLKYQVEAWLSSIVRPTEIATDWFPNTSVTALRFRSPGGDWVRAPNMGFGVSYSLPIVLAGLFAPERGGLLLIENPEAHLHPAGQSLMGVFLATIAAAGVQVVVETHSDHVLNGIRRAIGEHRVLGSDNAIVHFFDAAEDGEPKVSTLRFTMTGGLSEWPRRFFDQYQIDVSSLARVRRKPER